MKKRARAKAASRALGLVALGLLVGGQGSAPPSPNAVLETAAAGDWRSVPQEKLVYLMLGDGGRVVIELAPAFAPRHVANVRKLVGDRFFDGLSVNRVQDNYVVQWGDASEKRPLGSAEARLEPEWERAAEGLAIVDVPGPDGYAPAAGFVNGWPVAHDPKRGRAWLAHCYGMVGAGRGDTADSGNGSELYAVIGHAPRHLDRNVTLVGRVVDGIERLSALPRGTGELGFYESAGERVPIRHVRMGTAVPERERVEVEVLRTERPVFARWVEARRNRSGWFVNPAGHADLCNLMPPVRVRS